MSQGIFYLLDDVTEEQQLTLLCHLVTDAWREHRSVRVWCRDQQAAEQLDQALWQQPADAFVPHQLVTEGTAHSATVELCWPTAEVRSRRVKVLVNWSEQWQSAQGSSLLIDQVPVAEQARAAARERYKQYRQQGMQLSTVAAAEYLAQQHNVQ